MEQGNPTLFLVVIFQNYHSSNCGVRLFACTHMEGWLDTAAAGTDGLCCPVACTGSARLFMFGSVRWLG
jgi:hypothetical protein